MTIKSHVHGGVPLELHRQRERNSMYETCSHDHPSLIGNGQKKKKGLFEVISGGRPLTGQYKNHQAVRPNTMSDTKREGTTLRWYQPASLEALGGGPQSTDYTCGKVEAVRRNYHAARGGLVLDKCLWTWPLSPGGAS